MSVSCVASKVNLCKWAERGGRLFRSECQAKQLYTSFLFTGREASHFIMHSSFWCFDEVLKFGQKGHVQFITPNCSGCVLVSAICQMYEGLDLKNHGSSWCKFQAFYLFAATGGGRRGRISKPFAQSATKGGDSARVMAGLSKWAWRGRQKPIKWTAVELINNRNIKCHVNFISRVGGLIKTQVKRGVEEFIGIEDHMACLWHKLLINASWHSGPSGSTFSKQYRSWLRNMPFFFVPVSIFGLFFFLFSPLLFFSLPQLFLVLSALQIETAR